jgi:hypothetical protein
MGFVSNAAETALIWVADHNQPAAVLALDQLQGRTPIVWTITALVAAISLATYRTAWSGAGWGRLPGRGRDLPAWFGLQHPGTNPRGELVPGRGGPVHRLDAGA